MKIKRRGVIRDVKGFFLSEEDYYSFDDSEV